MTESYTKIPAIVVPDGAHGLKPGVYTKYHLTKRDAEQLAGRARLWQHRHDPNLIFDLSHLPIHVGVAERGWSKLMLAVMAEHAHSVDI